MKMKEVISCPLKADYAKILAEDLKQAFGLEVHVEQIMQTWQVVVENSEYSIEQLRWWAMGHHFAKGYYSEEEYRRLGQVKNHRNY